MNWDECLKRRLVKRKALDEELIASLIKVSENKIKVNSLLQLNDISASIKLCLIYDSLREVLEAVAIKHGYKIYNHECYAGFLQEILSMKEESIDFDEFRKIRNSINYYGKNFKTADIKNLISEILKLRKKLLEMLK
jgi:hypothetical protein